jgi:hypothetical protein
MVSMFLEACKDGNCLWIQWLQLRSTDVLKMWGLSPNFRCQKGDLSQVPYWGPTIVEYMCTTLLCGAFGLLNVKLYTFLYVRGKKCSNFVENIIFHHIKCSQLGAWDLCTCGLLPILTLHRAELVCGDYLLLVLALWVAEFLWKCS